MKALVEQPWVQEAVDAGCERWPRGHDAWEAVTWAICRDPDFGTALNEAGTVRAATEEGALSIGLPTVTVLWEVRGSLVVVQGARFVEPRSPKAGRG